MVVVESPGPGRLLGKKRRAAAKAAVDDTGIVIHVDVDLENFEQVNLVGLYAGERPVPDAAVVQIEALQTEDRVPVFLVSVDLEEGDRISLSDVQINDQSLSTLLEKSRRDVVQVGVERNTIRGPIHILMAGMPGSSGTNPDDAPMASANRDVEDDFGLGGGMVLGDMSLPGGGGTDPDD
jgi:hypothetical protein